MTDSLTTGPDPAPSPAARVTRAAGHGGAGLILVDLWRAFGWFGADNWTAEQAQERWPVLTVTVVFVMAASHNLLNHLRSRRFADELRALRDALRANSPTPEV